MTEQSSTRAKDRQQEEGGIGEFIRAIIYAAVIAMTIRTFAFEPFNIPSSSMVPTLLIGDYLFVSKYTYGYGDYGTFWGLAPFSGRVAAQSEPHRGDVVVFKWPQDNSTDFIKRLIGLPGDRVQMKQGILYVNGEAVPRAQLTSPLPEPGKPEPQDVTDYTEHLPNGPDHIIRVTDHKPHLEDTPEFVVPPHHYFMMGDNRDNSADSREPDGGVGYVPEENLVGKAQVIFFSLDEDAHFWQFWKWPWAIRWSRMFRMVG